jgi:hypothetical protein
VVLGDSFTDRSAHAAVAPEGLLRHAPPRYAATRRESHERRSGRRDVLAAATSAEA